MTSQDAITAAKQKAEGLISDFLHLSKECEENGIFLDYAVSVVIYEDDLNPTKGLETVRGYAVEAGSPLADATIELLEQIEHICKS